MITYTTTSTEDELHQILKLQQKNLPQSVSEEEQQNEGFLTVEHTFNLLKKMHDKIPHTIAKDGNVVIGYALSMHPDFGDEIDVLKPMFTEIENVLTTKSQLELASTSTTLSMTTNYIVMGQICIDKAYRKQGIFRHLYKAMKETIHSEFDCIITEVDAKNTRSLDAHYAIGFEDLKTYTSGGQDWKLIVLK